MTHAYWREGGPEFMGVNIMGVAHGTDKKLVLAHKAAIDQHPAKGWYSPALHQRFLGRTLRNQAQRNFAFRLPKMGR